MTAIKPIQPIVAQLIREFNAGNGKARTATDLAAEIINQVRLHDRMENGDPLVRYEEPKAAPAIFNDDIPNEQDYADRDMED
jgi:hypothetical protein